MSRHSAVRGGLVLLEAALAIVIFAVAGGVILSMMNDGLAAQQYAREQGRLVDLARSGMALIESGAATAETLNGPVKGSLLGTGDESPAGGATYELRVQTTPWESEGLVLVTVQAQRTGSAGLGYTLRQLVKLSRPSEKGGAAP